MHLCIAIDRYTYLLITRTRPAAAPLHRGLNGWVCAANNTRAVAYIHYLLYIHNDCYSRCLHAHSHTRPGRVQSRARPLHTRDANCRRCVIANREQTAAAHLFIALHDSVASSSLECTQQKRIVRAHARIAFALSVQVHKRGCGKCSISTTRCGDVGIVDFSPAPLFCS